MALTLESLNAFGEYKFNVISKNNCSFVRSLQYNNPIDRFRTLCQSILNGKNQDVNQIEFDGLLYKLMETQPEKVNETLFELINELCVSFKNWISNKLETDTFSVDTFQEGYTKFYKLKSNFSRQLRYFENCVKKGSTTKSYSHIMLMANYAFYKNVVDQTYKYKGNDCQLHTILGSLINEKNMSVDKILPLFQMFKYYEKLSFVAGKRRDELFNIKNQQEFLVGLGSNVNFVKSLVNYINNAFNQLSLCTNADDKSKKLKGLKDVIRMGTQFHEREMFILYYKKSLAARLLENSNVDTDAEKEALVLFKENKSDNRNVQKMYDMVKDIDEFRLNKKYIVKLEVKVTQATQDKYGAAGLDITKFDKQKANIIPLAFGVWDLSLVDNNGHYVVPLELQYYLDIFNAYYTKRYQHRKLTYDFNNGTANISIVLGGVKYMIEMTTPQLFLMYQFNHTPEINAKDLAKNVGMTLKQLTPVLNSLIKCGLIDRQAGERTDPNLKFFVNTKFKSNQKEFSIVSFMNQNKTEEVDKEVQEQFAHKREDIVKCVLVGILKHSKEMTVESLFDACSKKLTIFQVTAQLFKHALTTAIKDEYVVQTVKDNVKYYGYMDKADSDDEFEDEAD